MNTCVSKRWIKKSISVCRLLSYLCLSSGRLGSIFGVSPSSGAQGEVGEGGESLFGLEQGDLRVGKEGDGGVRGESLRIGEDGKEEEEVEDDGEEGTSVL